MDRFAKEYRCDGNGVETELCIFREKNFGCRKLLLKLPYNNCAHWVKTKKDGSKEVLG